MSYLNKQLHSILLETRDLNLELGLSVGVGGVLGFGIALLIKRFLKLDCSDAEYNVFVSKINQEISKQKAMRNMGNVKKLENVLAEKKLRCGR